MIAAKTDVDRSPAAFIFVNLSLTASKVCLPLLSFCPFIRVAGITDPGYSRQFLVRRISGRNGACRSLLRTSKTNVR